MHASLPLLLLGSPGTQLVYLITDSVSSHVSVDILHTNVDPVVGSTRCPAAQNTIPQVLSKWHTLCVVSEIIPHSINLGIDYC